MRNKALKPETLPTAPAVAGAISAAKGHRHHWRLVLEKKPIAAEEGVAKVIFFKASALLVIPGSPAAAQGGIQFSLSSATGFACAAAGDPGMTRGGREGLRKDFYNTL